MADFPLGFLYRRPKIHLTLVAVFYAVGLVGHLLQPLRPLMLTVTPWFLLLSGLFLVWPTLANGKRGFRWWCLLVWLITCAIEAIGVATGMIFGSYHYGSVLGLLILGVPPVIGFNWVLVVLGAMVLSDRLPIHPGFRILVTGLIATLFDFMMEPSAISNGYWIWAGGTIPLQNYLAWFLIACAMALSTRLIPAKTPRSTSSADTTLVFNLIIQGLFFLIQDLALWFRIGSL